MKKVLIGLFICLCLCVNVESAHLLGSIVQFEEIRGIRYKVVHVINGDQLTVYYFSYFGEGTGVSSLVGVEVYQAGNKINDSFKENNR